MYRTFPHDRSFSSYEKVQVHNFGAASPWHPSESLAKYANSPVPRPDVRSQSTSIRRHLPPLSCATAALKSGPLTSRCRTYRGPQHAVGAAATLKKVTTNAERQKYRLRGSININRLNSAICKPQIATMAERTGKAPSIALNATCEATKYARIVSGTYAVQNFPCDRLLALSGDEDSISIGVFNMC